MTSGSAREREWLNRAVEMYLRYCSRNRTVARVSELAVFMKASRTHLNKRFLDAFGEPPLTILRERQLTRAKELLRSTRLSIDSVAVASGFGHRSTFYRVFRTRVGETPIQFREETDKLRLDARPIKL
jgi:AraC-like DNA-binding protein